MMPSAMTRFSILHNRLRAYTPLLVLLLLITCICPGSLFAPEATPKCPPAAHMDDAKDTYGSTVVADPYRWLEDQNGPETRAWIDAEQKCTEAALANLPGRAQLTKRLGGRLLIDSIEAQV